ncbi:iron complex transport system permease protein [Falsibacillus pallidus]|uniref:Iron complex transport system permease protein n=2 Tax=Falsibacillus pallidus TaxID=493781 RepID=A0A370G2I5_9BACI|nr:iron complex transport system permease protein [Falsibacillus pallidus]
MNGKMNAVPFPYKLIASLAVFAAAFVAAMIFGAADTSLSDVWNAFTDPTTSKTASMLYELRLPRGLGAALVGAALGVPGAIMQGMTRNPLADPGLLGLTAGANAALAAAMALLPSANYFSITIACFIGAAAGVLLVFGIGTMKRGGFSPLRIVLAGAAVSAFLTAAAEGIGIFFKVSKDVSMWTAGGLSGTSWSQIQLIAPFILIGIAASIFCSRQLTILSLNEEVAVGLGQNIAKTKAVLFLVIIILAGSSVALVGNMAFIGLMIPHIVRWLVGTDYRFILPISAIFGAAFMLAADTLARTISAPYETPVAAIVSLLGLPFFLFIVHKGGRAFS